MCNLTHWAMDKKWVLAWVCPVQCGKLNFWSTYQKTGVPYMVYARCDMAFIEPMHRNKPNITCLYGLYKISLVQANFLLTQFKIHSHWQALVSLTAVIQGILWYCIIMWRDCIYSSDISWPTVNSCGVELFTRFRSISWMVMPWLLASPGHHQPWYWLPQNIENLVFIEEGFQLHALSWCWEMIKNANIYFMFP